MFGAVVFDLDGLLIDSEPLWVRAELEVFADAGVVLVEGDCARTKGLRIDDVVAYWHDARRFAVTPAEVERRLVARVVELVSTEGRALPGIATALAASRSAARCVALASSSPTPVIEAALGRLGLQRAFDVVQSAENEPHGKPHPVVFLRAAERLGVSPLDCVVVEDSMAGVIAAKAARMECIAVPFDHPHYDRRFALADAVVPSLEAVTHELVTELSDQRRK